MEAETLADETVIARDAIKNVCAGRLDRIPEFYDEEFPRRPSRQSMDAVRNQSRPPGRAARHGHQPHP
jgi:hypothetical protein